MIRAHSRRGNAKVWLFAIQRAPQANIVMPGLVPGIHVLLRSATKTWMAGTSLAMTKGKINGFRERASAPHLRPSHQPATSSTMPAAPATMPCL